MASINKYLKEAKELVPKEQLTDEKKIEYLDKQIESFQTQAYRFEVDIEVAKRYIAVGEQIGGEEGYTSTGEKNIQESVQALRAIVINIEELCKIRDQLSLQS